MRLRNLVIACVAASLGVAAPAYGHGDPTGHYLETDSLYPSIAARGSQAIELQLLGVLQAVQRDGYPVKVAILGNESDVEENPGFYRQPQRYAELLATIGDKISVTWAHDWLLYPGLAIGATGSISGAAALLPRHCLAMWDAIQAGDVPRAQWLHFAVTDVCSQISRYNWPAGVKACINMQGRNVGPCRSPVQPRSRGAAGADRGRAEARRIDGPVQGGLAPPLRRR